MGMHICCHLGTSLELVGLHSEVDGLVGGLQGGGAPPGDELLRGGDGLAGGGGQGVAPRPHVLQRVRREAHAAAGGGGRRGGRRQREGERGRG